MDGEKLTRASFDGPIYSDMQRWQQWQRSRAPLARRIRVVLDPRARVGTEFVLTRWGAGDSEVVLVAIDSVSPSQVPALVDPLCRLLARGSEVALLAPFDSATALHHLLPAAEAVSVRIEPNAPPPLAVSAVLSAGDHLPAGGIALEWARAQSCPYIVVQHGILTPYTPPLPPEAHLLAWNEADVRFWTAGNETPAEVVGSQLLWRAARDSNSLQGPPSASSAESVTFLGQLHGAELPRRLTRRSVAALRLGCPLIYRPHPGESDIASRVQHRVWANQGIAVRSHDSLADAPGAILSHFSTGILESAAMGLPAYAYCAQPPTWLRQLWDRYEMAQWGDSQATSVDARGSEPAAAVAAYVEEVVS